MFCCWLSVNPHRLSWNGQAARWLGLLGTVMSRNEIETMAKKCAVMGVKDYFLLEIGEKIEDERTDGKTVRFESSVMGTTSSGAAPRRSRQ